MRLAPTFPEIYEALGTVASEAGDSVRSMNFLMIAAHLGPGDEERWRRLARLSAEGGALRQAIYCLSKLIARARTDLDALWDRSVLLAQVGEPRQALKGFSALARKRPADAEVAKWTSRCRHQLRDAAGARGALEGLLRDYPGSMDPEAVNMLAELRLAAGENEGALELISRAREQFVAGPLRRRRQQRQREQREGGSGRKDGAPSTAASLGGGRASTMLPVDLEVKAAVAEARLGRGPAARERLRTCLLPAPKKEKKEEKEERRAGGGGGNGGGSDASDSDSDSDDEDEPSRPARGRRRRPVRRRDALRCARLLRQGSRGGETAAGGGEERSRRSGSRGRRRRRRRRQQGGESRTRCFSPFRSRRRRLGQAHRCGAGSGRGRRRGASL